MPGGKESDQNIGRLQETELTPSEKARLRVINFAEKADSKQFDAYEDMVNLKWATAFPERKNITGVKASSKKDRYELQRVLGNMIEQKMSDTEYQSAYEHVDK